MKLQEAVDFLQGEYNVELDDDGLAYLTGGGYFDFVIEGRGGWDGAVYRRHGVNSSATRQRDDAWEDGGDGENYTVVVLIDVD